MCAIVRPLKPGADAYGKTITTADLKKHLNFIAGKQTEGRETATKGQRVAAAYIAAHFKKLGLKPGAAGAWEQYFSLVQDTVTSSTLSIGGQNFIFAKDYITNVRESGNQGHYQRLHRICRLWYCCGRTR
ncbi:hypothetical protein MKQ70_25740 [Chitinophaga sedimenti]|uniref:hypothetical protein n=1 Tax=Chitinophaga sedimenti TaxID=2033606 RepID=UPI00200567FF|nr:hypothetical protein [Chitinophaga sedimenti]MCK7558224.1 hypothetical protein [Chitinophaga sedimenti]